MAKMSRSALDLRLKAVERELRSPWRWSAALLGASAIAFFAGLSPPRLDVLQGRRLEIVEKGGAVTGAFGIGAAAAIQGSQAKSDTISWALRDLESGASASSNVIGHDGKGAGFLTLYAGKTSWLSLAAMATGVVADMGMKDRHEIWLMTNEGESSLYFGIPVGFEGKTVLSLSHLAGNPVLRGSGKNGTAFEFR